MKDFHFEEPTSVTEACELLAEDPQGSAVFAGGTDILVDLKAGTRSLRRLVSLQRVEELRRLEIGEDGVLHIGSMVSVNRVAHDKRIGTEFPGINEAALSLAAEQVRNQATVAGNLCMAVPSADMAPILLAHGASLLVSSPTGQRRIAVSDFFVGPRQTVLAPDDVVTAIEVGPMAAFSGAASLRQGGRVSLSLPIVSAAAYLVVEGDTCSEATVALGSVAPTPILAPEAAQSLIGTKLSDETIAEAGDLARASARPITDLRASREYRLELIRVLTGRVIRRAAERAVARAA
jgi:carbon-monoxide dehydrogenase medium subunit